ncbi:MAG: DUF3240 family protein [Gammaproteobacteria bacterium]|nr:DUF3240 family protein [Gammaproteobacteria bacterium]
MNAQLDNATHYLITLEAPAALEDLVVDCLLSLKTDRGFNSYSMSQYHHIHDMYSHKDQMLGYQHKIRFQVQITKDTLQTFHTSINKQLSGTGISYWVVPVLDSGIL